MGKQLSKAGMRLNTRRQRNQGVSQHQQMIANYGSSMASASRSIESDRTILTLKLQRDEFTLYKGRVQILAKKEHEIMRKLALAGKRETAKLLLRKRKLQDYLFEDSEKQLNLILSEVNNMEQLQERKGELEQLMEKNSKALKRIELLLSLEHIEKVLEDSQEGYGKQAEISRVLLLANSIGEQIKEDYDLDSELEQILAAGRASPLGWNRRGSQSPKLPEVEEKKEENPTVTPEDEEEAAEEEENKETVIVTDTEQILVEKLGAENTEGNNASEIGVVVITEVESENGSFSSTKAELGDRDDDNKSAAESTPSPSDNRLKKTETVSSSLLPNVPTEPVADEPKVVIQEAEMA